MRQIDLSVVTFQPDLALFGRLLASLAEATREHLQRNLFIHDNSADPQVAASLAAMAELQPGGAFARVEVNRSGTNLGFGRGHNANAALGSAPFVFVLNQDCVLEPGVLEAAVVAAETDDERVGAWEMRQIPYEHPKEYDPVTLDTPWTSGAALLLRRSAFDSVSGFEPRIFMYGEDVDLSWRLRARGWRVTYRPRTAVVHLTHGDGPHEVKPLLLFGGILGNLCLRARYGGVLRTLKGLGLLAAEIARRPTFAGRRRGLIRAGLQFLRLWPHFAGSRVRAAPGFEPHFAGWSYERRRDGAFLPFASKREAARPEPLVSVLIRTVGRPRQLAEALETCANQTYRNLEVVVIEDGPESSRAIVESFRGRVAIRYRVTGKRLGRARAGNLALAEARGEWLNFLDDDDVLFADHIEVLLGAALRAGAAGAYGLAWETQLHWLDAERSRYRESGHLTRFRHAFDRFALWHRNYLPIQAVLFYRRLWERHGGFLEDMDHLEDWNLWTRYTLEDDFVMVDKTTSKYRVPGDAQARAERLALLDRAYPDAVERQRQLQVTLSPRHVVEMAQGFVRAHRGEVEPVVSKPAAVAAVDPDSYEPKLIQAKRFANEKVLLDGYEYQGCEFVNVTFEYNGTTPIRLQNNKIGEPFRLSSENPMVLSTIAWLYGMGMVRSDMAFAPGVGQIQRAPETMAR